MQTFFIVLGLILPITIASGAFAQATQEVAPPEVNQENQKNQSSQSKQSSQAEQQERKIEPEKKSASFSGEVFVIRSGPKTEVFFRNHNQSYFIQKNNKHNGILKSLQKIQKSNKKVSIEFNPKTKEIIEVKESQPESKGDSNASSNR